MLANPPAPKAPTRVPPASSSIRRRRGPHLSPTSARRRRRRGLRGSLVDELEAAFVRREAHLAQGLPRRLSRCSCRHLGRSPLHVATDPRRHRSRDSASTLPKRSCERFQWPGDAHVCDGRFRANRRRKRAARPQPWLSVVVLTPEVCDERFAFHPAQRVFEFNELDEKIVLGIEVARGHRALEIEAEPLLNPM
jgi:hypothetical protein